MNWWKDWYEQGKRDMEKAQLDRRQAASIAYQTAFLSYFSSARALAAASFLGSSWRAFL